jgi:hypothetical protein
VANSQGKTKDGDNRAAEPDLGQGESSLVKVPPIVAGGARIFVDRWQTCQPMVELHVMVPWGPCFPFFLNPPIALQKLNFYTLKFLIFLFLPCQTSNASFARCQHAYFPLIWFFTKRGVGYKVCAKIWQITILFLVNFWPN